jgi:hypothetical protein
MNFKPRFFYRLPYVLAFWTGVPLVLDAQPARSSMGVTAQVYPAGVIAAVRFAYPVSEQDVLAGHLGYNATDRRDWGKHDDEAGDGPGFGLGWRHYRSLAQKGVHWGTRVDLWFLEIDWKQNTGESGSTAVRVLQPTAQLGYTWQPGSGKLLVELTLALGMEINIQTDGEAIGEGAILLGGINVSYRF